MDAHGFVMVKAEPLPEGTPIVQGYDFNKVHPRSEPCVGRQRYSRSCWLTPRDGTAAAGGCWLKQGLDYEALMASLKTTGFQATSFGQAVDEVNRMVPGPPPPHSCPRFVCLLFGGGGLRGGGHVV
jgi:hypothetical protein